MSLRKCKDCPCIQKKTGFGLLGSSSYWWYNKFDTKRDPNQEACSRAKEEDRTRKRVEC